MGAYKARDDSEYPNLPTRNAPSPNAGRHCLEPTSLHFFVLPSLLRNYRRVYKMELVASS